MNKHKIVAIIIFISVAVLSISRDGIEDSKRKVGIMAAFLVLILFSKIITIFSGVGPLEIFAKDYGSENDSGPYTFFFWVLFLIACSQVIFKWSIY